MEIIFVMNEIKIGLVQIDNGNEGSITLPYTTGVLQAYYLVHGQNNESVTFLEPIFMRCAVEEAVNALSSADIVLFSVYSWNFQISLAIAKRLKEVSPHVLNVFGGPMIPPPTPQNPKTTIDFLLSHPCIDIMCHGEGERICKQIIDNFDTKDWSAVPCISYYDGKQYKIGLENYRESDLDSLPSPYLLGVFDGLLAKYPHYRWVTLWETNRGCPFSCAYCAWGKSELKKVYKFSTERVQKELEWFATHKIEHVFGCDSNFGLFERDVEVAEYAAMVHKKTNYPKSIHVYSAKNKYDRVIKIHEILSDAGITSSISLALQSVSPIVLENIGRINITAKYFSELQKYFAQHNVYIGTDLIIGLPGETYNSFVDGINSIIENGQFCKIFFYFLSILQNSRMISPEYIEKFGIKTVVSNFTLRNETEAVHEVNELQEIVISSASMSATEWKKTCVYAWMTAFLFYNKLLQIPLVLLKWDAKIPFSALIEAFIVSDSRFPIFSKITEFLFNAAESIQNGGQVFHFSKDNLNMGWRHDDYLFLETVKEENIDAFYEECFAILKNVTSKYHEEAAYSDILKDALRLNKAMIKTPSHSPQEVVTLSYNILEYYNGIKLGQVCFLQEMDVEYTIIHDRTWQDWQEWIKEVVWFESYKADYLWTVQSSNNVLDCTLNDNSNS